MSSSPFLTKPVEPDKFRLARIMALQPELEVADLADEVQTTEDAVILGHMEHLMHLWASSRKDLPVGYAESIEIKSVTRQPLVAMSVFVQRAERRLVRKSEPSNGQNIDASAWQTDDVFALMPIATLEFPRSPKREMTRVDGREESVPCAHCQGAGTHDCDSCVGSKHVTCMDCGGSRTVLCPTCQGAGSQIGITGNEINCRQCRGRTTITCRGCDKSGLVPCNTCRATGTVRCAECLGLGNHCHFWELVTSCHTDMTTKYYLREPWPIDASKIVAECDAIFQDEWEWPDKQGPATPLDQALRGGLSAFANDAIRKLLQNDSDRYDDTNADTAELNTEESPRRRDTGTRITFHGTYVYRVSYTHRGQPGVIYIAGNRNIVFGNIVPAGGAGIFKRALRGVLRFFARIDSGKDTTVDRPYIDAVRAGLCHISDSMFLGPTLSEQFKVKAKVTADGYSFTLPANKKYGSCERTIKVAFDLDASQQIMLSATIPLGSAHRDKFVKAFAANHALPFGRIGVMETAPGQEEFFLMDRRPYLHTTAGQYYVILCELLASWFDMSQEQLLG